MLRHLAIRHFAIIREVEIDIGPGFTAITGETGAGKSILVDALGLLLGDRAESGLIAEGQKQAELEAVFSLAQDDPARRWLADQALEEGDQLILRRVLTAPSGSRAWINGRSATVSQLAELGGLLVEIHGQHEHQQLEKPAVQRRLVDRRVEDDTLEAVAERFRHWETARKALDELEAVAGDADQLDLLRFQVRELSDLALAQGEFESLELEQERLARSDDVRLAIASAGAALDSEDGPGARGLIHQAIQALEPVRELEAELDETAKMLEEARINIDEAHASLERMGSEDDGDPERLATVNRRLEKALDLARKHRVQPGELPDLTAKLSDRLETLENQGERREELVRAVERAGEDWRSSAQALSQSRKKAAKALSSLVTKCLGELGMDTASLSFRVDPDAKATPARQGMDRVTIEFSANPGQPLQPLSKVASGGELSRVALALMIAADRREGPKTRIFDEVDAGVGGETAHAVGRFLREAAGAGQAMCVTHLAQVAACADHQMRVRKQKGKGATDLAVESLDDDARRREIARMLGSSDSDKSLAHASEMLEKER
ncbi:MAG: DNA repair protein RecN [Gammaproteobacteria bacterium]|jgi:DNA repair protein RecN (Recombination protein N)|nr:DNA repair protein RecN [Gammaproteobacteria bacterium]